MYNSEQVDEVILAYNWSTKTYRCLRCARKEPHVDAQGCTHWVTSFNTQIWFVYF